MKFILIFALVVPIMANAQGKISAGESDMVRADSLMQREDYAGALVIYNKLLSKSKLASDEDYGLLYKRAYCFYSTGKFDEALADISKFLQKIPDVQAKLLRAYINQELGNTEDQLKDLNDFIASSPDNMDLIRWRASVLMELEKHAEARRDIRKILEEGPNPDIKAYLGLTYYYANDPDSALLVFDEVIAENPKHVQTYVYAASVALEEEIYGLATQYIEKGLLVERNNSTLLFYKGIALVHSEQTDEGCRCLSKAFGAGVDDAGDYLKSFCYGVN